MKELAAYLETREDIQTVFFNENGKWCFTAGKLYPIAKSREDVIAEANAEPEASPAQALKNLKKK